MHHMDVPILSRVKYYARTLSKTHDKAGQCNAELKDVLSTIQNDLLHKFIDKKFVSLWNRFRTCVAATC